MPYQIKIEIVPSKRDDYLINEAFEYINITEQNCDLDAATPATHFMQSIYKIIAMRHGLEPRTINGLQGKLHDDFLELKSGIISKDSLLSDFFY